MEQVILVMASTVDGKIAKDFKHVTNWTGTADKKYYSEITKNVGVMIMGSTTYDTIGKPLPDRLNIVMTQDESRKSNYDNLIFTRLPPVEVLENLKLKGFKKATIVGGSTINSLFIKDNLITHIHLVIVPKLFGSGLSLFNSPLNQNLLLETTQLLDNGCVLVIYKIKNKNYNNIYNIEHYVNWKLVV